MTSSAHLKDFLARIEKLVQRSEEIDTELFGLQREMSDLLGGTKHTYIFEADGTGLVKIGRARDVQKRLRRLQKGSPAGLRLMRLFPFDCERLLHRRYAPLRQHGEWFKYCPTMQTIFGSKEKSSLNRALAVPAVSHDPETGEITDTAEAAASDSETHAEQPRAGRMPDAEVSAPNSGAHSETADRKPPGDSSERGGEGSSSGAAVATHSDDLTPPPFLRRKVVA